jgi:hypothetical protein
VRASAAAVAATARAPRGRVIMAAPLVLGVVMVGFPGPAVPYLAGS